MVNTIGFFGDSFCAERMNGHSLIHRYKSYMVKLEDHYNCKTTNVGIGGSGVWDLIINQFNPMLHANSLPDVCVFFWSKPGRLFHRKIRKLSIGHISNKKYSLFNKHIYDAAEQYYVHLQDYEKEKLEYLSAIEYFDRHTLSKLNKKIIHFWCFEVPAYRFINGVEIHPPLYNLSLINSNPEMLHRDFRCNHLEGDKKNSLVFEWIRDAIDNYQSGTLVDKSQEVDRLAI